MTIKIVEYFSKFNIKSSENCNKNAENVPILRQCLIVLGPLLLTTNLGMIFGYSAVLLPQLQSVNSTMMIDRNEASWIASIATLPMAFGCLISMYLMDTYGRKLTQLLTIIPLTIGWLCIYLTNNNIKLLLIGRFLNGICIGLLGPITSVYISEITIPKLRNYFLPLITFNLSFGILLIHLFGIFYNWQQLTLLPLILLLITLICLIPIPESFIWLIKIKQIDVAEVNFNKCYGYQGNSIEFQQILKNYQQINEQKNDDHNQAISKLFRSEFLKPFGILIVFFITTQWSGINAITFYTINIIKDIFDDNNNNNNNNNKIDENQIMIIIDTIRLIASLFSCLLLKQFGRRTITLLSGSGTFLSLLVLVITLHYTSISTNSVLIICMLILYIIFLNIGFVPIPWTMIGELFPLNLRNYGTSLTSMVAFLAFFSVVQLTPLLTKYCGIDGIFVIFSISSLIGTVFLYFYLPETKNKQLYEIERLFKK